MHLAPLFRLPPMAAAYELLTSQDHWRDQIAALLAHHPAATTGARLRVLDLGCGPGESVFVLARVLAERRQPAEILGIDISPAMIRRARRRQARHHPDLEDVHVRVADARRLELPDGCVHLALGHSFLYLVPDRLAVLREIHRVLAPAGQLLLMEPHGEGSLWRAARHELRPARGLRHPVASLRFLASMVLWRLFSGSAGQLHGPQVTAWFQAAGFAETTTQPTLGGLGLHCIGHKGDPREPGDG